MTAPGAEELRAIAPLALAATLLLAVLVTTFAAVTYRRDRVISERENPWAERVSGLWGRASERAAVAFDGTGTTLTPGELTGAWVSCALLPPLTALVMGLAVPLAAALALAGALAPVLWASRARRRARARFESTLASALPLVASNLRGGLSFRASLVPVGESMPEPLRGEFARLGADIDGGAPVEEALARMADRNDSKDVSLLASAVMAQRVTGGNLADVIDSAAVAVRDRCELRRQVRSKTSQARMSARILAALPVVLLVAMCAISSTFREFYASPVGLATIALMACLVVAGYAAMAKMSNMRVD